MADGRPDHDLLRVPKGRDIRRVIVSEPPPGHYRVVNIWVNSETGKAVVEYEDKPVS